MVGRGERRERNFVISRLCQPLEHRSHDVVSRSLAHGAVHHARLAEAATTGTSAENLDVQTIVHSLGERHDARLPRRAFRKPAEHLLLDERGKALFQRLDPRTGFLCFISFAPTIQRRHIPPIKRSERTPYLTTRRPTCTLGADDLEPFGKRLLALPNVYGIEERRVRLGVERTWTTGNDERVIF